MASTKSWNLASFSKDFGALEVREYKTLGFNALVAVDDEGEETFINPGRTGLTHVDFNKSCEDIADALSAHKDDLDVLEGTTEAGNTCYTLVDHREFSNHVVKVFL